MNKIRVAITLLVISLALLVIYGIDVIVASSLAGPASGQTGFLPFDASVRGSVFGGAAVVMSIVAFLISRKERSWAVSSLLFVNGGLILIGMIFLITDGALASGDSAAMRTITTTIGTGVILVGLGIWRVITDARLVEHRKTH